MSVIDIIQTTINNFYAAVRSSDDAHDPRVTEALDTCEEASAAWAREADTEMFTAWQREKDLYSSIEPVLQSANLLMDVISEINPNEIPLEYRTLANNTQKIIDKADELGYRVRASFEPKP